MNKRTVTLKLTSQKDVISFESSARTFGDLKKEMKDVKWDGMRVVERVSKNTLQMDDAILPGTDFLLFLVPEKVKSGHLEEIGNIDEASYNECRSHISYLNKEEDADICMSGGLNDLRERLNDYYNDDEDLLSDCDDDDDEIDAITAIENAREKINEAIDLIIANSGNLGKDETEYLFKLSIDDLEKEVINIKSKLAL